MALKVSHRNKIKNCIEHKYSIHFKLYIKMESQLTNEIRNMVRLTYSEQCLLRVLVVSKALGSLQQIHHH